MHPDWLSNAYLVYAQEEGDALFVDSGAPLKPLLQAVEASRVRPRWLLRTHSHPDHVEHEDELRRRFDLELVAADLGSADTVSLGGAGLRLLSTPGHSDDGVSFVLGEDCFSGDTLFKDAVGGTQTDFDAVRRSVMEALMTLPPETMVYPGHTDETTIGREWEENPFVRVWRGVEPEGTEPCRVGGSGATLVVWSPDYDGKGKAWVRLDEGRDMIVGGSRVERR